MIQVKDCGEFIEVDNGKDILHFESWCEMVQNIGKVKLYSGQNLYIREGSKLHRVKLNGEKVYPKG